MLFRNKIDSQKPSRKSQAQQAARKQEAQQRQLAQRQQVSYAHPFPPIRHRSSRTQRPLRTLRPTSHALYLSRSPLPFQAEQRERDRQNQLSQRTLEQEGQHELAHERDYAGSYAGQPVVMTADDKVNAERLTQVRSSDDCWPFRHLIVTCRPPSTSSSPPPHPSAVLTLPNAPHS